VAAVRRTSSNVRAVIFDLDETLRAREKAWAYAVEEAVIAVTGRRVDAAPLAPAYRQRPWRHVLSVLVDAPADRDACESLCDDIYRRSAMKRLLVQEGVGMALDVLRGASVEIGAVSREPHATARRQLESTGLDRFMTVLSATPGGERWDALARAEDCRAFLGRQRERCVFVSHDSVDLRTVGRAGYACLGAGWACEERPECPVLERPAELGRLLDRLV
jgi:phosphoglycolate phosphatase-like HAD superfamily hydrolase